MTCGLRFPGFPPHKFFHVISCRAINYYFQGFNGKLIFAIIASALGSSFQHGYNTGVINTPQTVSSSIIIRIITGSATKFQNITYQLMFSNKILKIFEIFKIKNKIHGLIRGTFKNIFKTSKLASLRKFNLVGIFPTFCTFCLN